MFHPEYARDAIEESFMYRHTRGVLPGGRIPVSEQDPRRHEVPDLTASIDL